MAELARIQTMSEEKAKAWYVDLMHWINKTGPHNKTYKPNLSMNATFHWIWIMGRVGGRKGDYTKSDINQLDVVDLPRISRKVSLKVFSRYLTPPD